MAQELFIIWVIWGEGAVRKFSEGKVVSVFTGNVDGHAKVYCFKTEAEQTAFLLGVSHANGWMDSLVLTESPILTKTGIKFSKK